LTEQPWHADPRIDALARTAASFKSVAIPEDVRRTVAAASAVPVAFASAADQAARRACHAATPRL
jgi:hypothetical protein